MTDTTPEITEMVRQKLMAHSNEDRLRMGVWMFEAARQMILASLPKDLSGLELRRQFYERVYGTKAPF